LRKRGVGVLSLPEALPSTRPASIPSTARMPRPTVSEDARSAGEPCSSCGPVSPPRGTTNLTPKMPLTRLPWKETALSGRTRIPIEATQDAVDAPHHPPRPPRALENSFPVVFSLAWRGVVPAQAGARMTRRALGGTAGLRTSAYTRPSDACSCHMPGDGRPGGWVSPRCRPRVLMEDPGEPDEPGRQLRRI